MLTPVIDVALPTPSVCPAGAAIASDVVAFTAIVCFGALLPKLSVAFSVMVSAPAVLSVSVSVPRSVFTCASEPVMVRLVVTAPSPRYRRSPTAPRSCQSASP